jgi:hypothetical protein
MSSQDISTSTTSMMPLMSRVLLYGEREDEDEEVAGATGVAAAQSTVVEVAAQSEKGFCEMLIIVQVEALILELHAVCVKLILECFLLTVRKTKDNPEGCNDVFFLSDVCCLWHDNRNIDVEAVRKEHTCLQNLLKKKLVKLA